MTYRPIDSAQSAASNVSDFSSSSWQSPERPRVGERLAEFYLDPSASTVMVVDDSKDVRDVVVWLLGTCGCRARTAQDGLHAKLMLQEVQPAVIISDLRMPVCDGWDLL